jgi:hypothetical protein
MTSRSRHGRLAALASGSQPMHVFGTATGRSSTPNTPTGTGARPPEGSDGAETTMSHRQYGGWSIVHSWPGGDVAALPAIASAARAWSGAGVRCDPAE